VLFGRRAKLKGKVILFIFPPFTRLTLFLIRRKERGKERELKTPRYHHNAVLTNVTLGFLDPWYCLAPTTVVAGVKFRFDCVQAGGPGLPSSRGHFCCLKSKVTTKKLIRQL